MIGNTIQNTPQDAINLVHNLTNVVIDHNDVSTTQTPQCGDHTDLVQIEADAKGPFTITNNVFHDGMQFILRNATGLTIENNLILRVQQWMQLVADPGARIINNTWWNGNNCPDGAHGCTAGSLLIREYAPGSSWTQAPFNYTNHMTGTIIENNIMRVISNDAVNPVAASAYHEDYNLIYGPRQNNSGLQGTHTLFAMPAFQNPTTNNYQLTPTSPGTGTATPPSHPGARPRPASASCAGRDPSQPVAADKDAGGVPCEGVREGSAGELRSAFGAFRRATRTFVRPNPPAPYMCLAGLKRRLVHVSGRRGCPQESDDRARPRGLSTYDQ